jgi:putative FmdB family regulatory protein
MPIYEYRCDNGHTFEVVQRMSEDPLTSCTTCSASVQRVFHPVAVHFKGSGFYTTDYGKKKRSTPAGESSKSEPSSDGASAGASSSSPSESSSASSKTSSAGSD